MGLCSTLVDTLYLLPTADAEETCVAYVASVLRLCRTTGSGPDHQAACVKQVSFSIPLLVLLRSTQYI